MAETDLIIDYLNGNNESDFSKELYKFRKSAERKTGFSNWDKYTNLYSGLYIIGAISSLGKTSFCLQMADQLASNGETVLYFSLEQTKLELTSKSLSRYMYNTTGRKASAINIRRGYFDKYDYTDKYEEAEPLNEDVLNQTIEAYTNAVENRLYICECNFDTTIEDICNFIDDFIAEKKVSPVVFIDYLQVLKSSRYSSADKLRIDYIVELLKSTQKKNDLVFFVISSLNRQNYMTPIDFESFKESGGIEYTADVLLGLQLQAIHDEIFNKESKLKEKREIIERAKREIPRKVELVCKKNRYGISSYSCGFEYYPNLDLFIPEKDFSDME